MLRGDALGLAGRIQQAVTDQGHVVPPRRGLERKTFQDSIGRDAGHEQAVRRPRRQELGESGLVKGHVGGDRNSLLQLGRQRCNGVEKSAIPARGVTPDRPDHGDAGFPAAPDQRDKAGHRFDNAPRGQIGFPTAERVLRIDDDERDAFRVDSFQVHVSASARRDRDCRTPRAAAMRFGRFNGPIEGRFDAARPRRPPGDHILEFME